MDPEIRDLLRGLRCGNPPPCEVLETYTGFDPTLPPDYLEAVQKNDERANAQMMRIRAQSLKGGKDSDENNW